MQYFIMIGMATMTAKFSIYVCVCFLIRELSSRLQCRVCFCVRACVIVYQASKDTSN